MKFIDTHCHIHDSEFVDKYDQSQKQILIEARESGVAGFVCVGTDAKSSLEAILFAQSQPDCFASVALHPHEAAGMSTEEIASELTKLDKILKKERKNIIAIGECGLDYYYHENSDVRDRQKHMLRGHMELAVKYQLPLIFHIRNPKNDAEADAGEAFIDFFTIYDEYELNGGVVHSFSSNIAALKGSLTRGLYIGLNGIMTFTKQTSQLQAATMVPLERLVLETDAPFLTPEPFRGTMCLPKHIVVTAEFLSELRGETLEDLARATTTNAKQLFGI